MDDTDKSAFFSQNGESTQAIRDAASKVNSKHETGEPARKRGRPRKNPVVDSPEVSQPIPETNTPYIDPETVRTGFKALVKTIDQFVALKFYNVVLRATNGDTGLAEQFKKEASISNDLLEAYGEAAVGLARKYDFLLQYAPEALMVSCIVADAGIKVTTFKKIQELCNFVAKVNHASPPQAD